MKSFICRNIRTFPKVGFFVYALSPLWYNCDNVMTAAYIFVILTILISAYGLLVYPKKISETIMIFSDANIKSETINLLISIIGITICLLFPSSDAMARYVIVGIDIWCRHSSGNKSCRYRAETFG